MIKTEYPCEYRFDYILPRLMSLQAFLAHNRDQRMMTTPYTYIIILEAKYCYKYFLNFFFDIYLNYM